MKKNRIFIILTLFSLVMVGAWALESQNVTAQVQPTDFDPGNENDYPNLTDIDFDVQGLADIGEIYMLEGIENTTSVDYSSSGGYSPGNTSYPRLVLHGVFDKILRDWRDKIIDGTKETHDIELNLNNKSGKRVLRITFYDAMPVKFSFPPLSVENNTRYMERVEFVYTYFDVTN